MSDVNLLGDLLKSSWEQQNGGPRDGDGDDVDGLDDDGMPLDRKPTGPAHPGLIGAPQSRAPTKPKVPAGPAPDSDDIWGTDEVSTPDDASDPRPLPEYDILYKQRVSTEDIYLGMRGKNESVSQGITSHGLVSFLSTLNCFTSCRLHTARIWF